MTLYTSGRNARRWYERQGVADRICGDHPDRNHRTRARILAEADGRRERARALAKFIREEPAIVCEAKLVTETANAFEAVVNLVTEVNIHVDANLRAGAVNVWPLSRLPSRVRSLPSRRGARGTARLRAPRRASRRTSVAAPIGSGGDPPGPPGGGDEPPLGGEAGAIELAAWRTAGCDVAVTVCGAAAEAGARDLVPVTAAGDVRIRMDRARNSHSRAGWSRCRALTDTAATRGSPASARSSRRSTQASSWRSID